MKRNKTGIIVSMIAVVVFAGIGTLLLWPTSSRQLYPPLLIGPLVRLDTTDRNLIYYLTAEDRERSRYSRRGFSTFQSVRYTVFELYARDASNGKLIKKKTLAEINDAHYDSFPRILGTAKGGLWVYINGPKLYDPLSLDLLADVSAIQSRNPSEAALVPGDQAFFKVSNLHQQLIYKDLHGEFMQVDGVNLKISPADETLLENVNWQKDAETGFRYVRSTGYFPFYNYAEGYLINSFLTSNGLWHALWSKKQHREISKWPGVPYPPQTGGSNRYLQGKYVLDDKNEIELNVSTVKEVGRSTFLDGGFLKRGVQSVWDVASPSSSLVMCHDILGPDGQWVVHRLGRDGKSIWQVATGLVEMGQVADGKSHLILEGFQTRTEPTRMRKGVLVFVDEQSGKLQTVPVTE